MRRSKKGGWTKEEDEILRQAVQEFKGRSWKKIAERLPNRTNVQCLHRWQKVLNPALVKGPWTPEEDEKIISLVEKYGCENWSLIAEQLDGRIGKQCRERYFNQLDPSIKKTPWTEEEKRTLMESQKKLGNKWAEISKILVGRPNNQCKNMYHSIMAKRRKEKKKQEKEQKSMPRSHQRTRSSPVVDPYSNSEMSQESSMSDASMSQQNSSPSIMVDQPPVKVENAHAAQRFLRSNPKEQLKRGHHRSYSDSAVINFHNFPNAQGQGQQFSHGIQMPQSQNVNQPHYLQPNANMYSVQMRYQAKSSSPNMANMTDSNMQNVSNSRFSQNSPQHFDFDVNHDMHDQNQNQDNRNDNNGVNSFNPMRDSNQENHDSKVSNSKIHLIEEPPTPPSASFPTVFDHSRRRSQSLVNPNRNLFDPDEFWDLHGHQEEDDPLGLNFNTDKGGTEENEKPPMDNNDAMDTKEDVFDMDPFSPDNNVDPFQDSPKPFRVRGHQRSQSFDPRMLSGHRFQPF